LVVEYSETIKTGKFHSNLGKIQQIRDKYLMHKRRSRFLIWLVSVGVLAFCSSTYVAAQSESDLRDGHPDRYVVQEGDTLWSIANKFLKDPWRWPLIWQENEQIENPHLIFPGDLLVLTSDFHLKVVRLEPSIHRTSLDRAITTIPPHIIQPFLTSSLIVDEGELESAGHIIGGVEDELILGKLIKFYARGLGQDTADEYRIFRVGRTLRDPETAEVLGVEGIHLGDAAMERQGEDVSKLQILSSNREIRPGDRLVPIEEKAPLSYYTPHAPDRHVSGWILLAPRGVRDVGRFDVVIVSGGERDGLEEGHVLKAMFHRGTRKDPVTGEEFMIPDEVSGLMMVFKVFEKLSYALIMEATRAISVGDKFESPQ
jgi:nucleoid-associated protein YgaU